MLTRIVLTLAAALTVVQAADWPQWRGPRLDGRSSEGGFPTRWSKTENIRWRTELPGQGHASVIVQKDRLFTVEAHTPTQERRLICLDRADGKIRWSKTVIQSPMERLHRENSHASSTPAADGESVYCSFLDGKDVVIAAYDLEGNQRWLKRPGTFSSVHGFCSTPILYKDKVIVNCDHDGDGYIVALARQDGRELWRIDRPNKTRSYCAPLIREAAGKTQMVLSGSKCVASYNPDDGKLIWIIDGPTDQFVASPVYSEKTGLFYITGGFPDHHILAIKPDGSGNVTNTHIAWHHKGAKGVAYVPSPIIEGDWFLVTDDRGFAHAFHAQTGDIGWNLRIGRSHASLTSAGGVVYFLTDEGACYAVRLSANFEVIAKNELGEGCYASPALSEGQIFLRSDRAVYCVEQRNQ